jgi:polysaccharide chain length determinant protein (PEP-CTERM system associated)
MTQRELTLPDYVAILKRRWVLITVLALVGPVLAYGVSRFLPNRYKSQTLVLVQPPSVPTTMVAQVDTTSINQRLASMQQEILSRSRLEPIIRQFGLFPTEVNRVPMDDLVGRLQKAIDVTPVSPMAQTSASDLPGFFVGVTWDDAGIAQEICTTVTSMFIEESIGMQTQHSDQTTQFLTQQLADSKTALDAEDAKLAAFQIRYFGSLPDDGPANMNVLTGLTSQLDSSNQALARAQQDKSFAESMLAPQLAAWQAARNGADPDNLEAQLSASQAQLTSLEARYTDDYPDVIKAKANIAALRKKIDETDGSDPKVKVDSKRNSQPIIEPPQITQLRGQIHVLDQTIEEKTREEQEIKKQIGLYQAHIQATPLVEQQYKELTRGYQTALDSYNDLLRKRNEAAMSGALNRDQQGEQFRVLDPASRPDKPSFPNRPLFALGGFGGGLALGVGLAFFLALQDTCMRSERDVELALRFPVLAMIPAIEIGVGNNPGGIQLNSSGASTIGLRAGS